MQQDQQKIIRISRKKFIWLVIIIVLIAIGFFVLRGMTRTIGMSGGMALQGISGGNSTTAMPMYDTRESDIYQPEYNQSGSIKDTREFLKTNYSGTINTRNISNIVDTIENTIRDLDGRIDSVNSSDKSGYISFVIPKSNFYEFKDTIESLTHRKLYTENISSQNLLGQKQTIEQQIDGSLKNLEQWESEKKENDRAHTARLARIQKDIAKVRAEIVAVEEEKATTTDATRVQQLTTWLFNLRIEESDHLAARDAENREYAISTQEFNDRIADAKNGIDNALDRDEKFTDNIETVNGSINVRWISIWNIARIFSPIPPVLIILILIALFWFIGRKMNIVPKIVLV